MRKENALFILSLFILIVAISMIGCSNSNGDQPDDGDVAVHFNINEPQIKEKLGEDDGYAFTIFYGSDIKGSLETCG